jgi:hypothetical protein
MFQKINNSTIYTYYYKMYGIHLFFLETFAVFLKISTLPENLRAKCVLSQRFKQKNRKFLVCGFQKTVVANQINFTPFAWSFPYFTLSKT